MTRSKASHARKPARTDRPRPAVAEAPAKASGITIAGVGASAGGLESLIQLLDALPANPGLALVLVQHMAPHHDSALPLLLASHTTLPVVQVTDGIRVEANHVYVIPPNVQMELSGNTLILSPRPDDATQHTPIDTYFTSLARLDGRAIAVVLSGTGSDGAIGIREVKAAGGITLAQKPETAKYDGMPRAAIATGMVDMVLPPAGIGTELAELARHPYVRMTGASPDELKINDEQLNRVFALLTPTSGVDFGQYKKPTMRRRLLRRMALHRIAEVETYLKLLHSNRAEARGLFQDLLIHVTRFFRDPESFEAMAEHIFPKIVAEREPQQPIRAWVCGCATGEEAYSLAITLVRFLQKQHLDHRLQIFATDVSESAIGFARAGVYPASVAADVGAARLRDFFTRSDGHYRVSKQIRDACVFAKQDLTRDPPFSRLDLVLCRNVLIYMDTMLQRRLITMFHYALNATGYLVLGPAETVGGQASLFSLVDKKHRVHRKKSVPVARPASEFRTVHPTIPAVPARPLGEGPGDKGLPGEVSKIMLDRYAPAGVVVDADLQIVQFRGQTGMFLEPAPGDASLTLLKMAREGLLHGLRTALHAARKSKAPVRREGLEVRVGPRWQPVTIEVVPLTASGRPHYLVLFETPGRDTAAPDQAAMPAPSSRPKSKESGAASAELLERELAASRDYLQSIIQELEAANEELQSANEEILSSNEELQSTNEELDTAKEELQSTNEELNTLNEELQGRNEEMGRVNSDLLNLVASVQIAIVIVGSDLRIRRFTPMAEKILNLIPGDVERSIGHINPNIEGLNLEQLIVECMEGVMPVEREVQDREGRWYSLRIRPYKNLENRIDGAVLALIDVDMLKRSENRAARARDFTEAVMQSSTQPLAVLSPDLFVRQVNVAFAAVFALLPEDLRGRQLAELGGAAWMLDGWHHAVKSPVGSPLPPVPIPPDPAGRWHAPLRLMGRVVPSPDVAGATVILISLADATPPRDTP